jgi:hypothetical protein
MRMILLTMLFGAASMAVSAQPTTLEGAKFFVEATESGRLTPFSLPLAEGTPASVTLRADGGSGLDVPLTVVGTRVYGVLPAATPAGTHTFVVREAKYKGEPSVSITQKGDTAVEVSVGGDLVTAYHFSKDDRKPYLWPVLGEGGASLTRDWPFSGKEGKTKDHPHHVSFWSAHGDINGADFWEYGERTGWQVPDAVMTGSGYAAGWINSRNTWTDNDRKPVIAEERSYILYNTPASGRLIDITVKFTAEYGDVKFGDTKEGGIIGLRMADDLRETGGTGKITTSEGAVGEKAAWGKPAAWCDYSGTLEGFGARGITVMDSPQSFRYPVHWHVRGYGLMGANPFGYNDFYNGAKNGDHTLPKGESLTFSYRIYLHSGDATAADVAGHYKDFANPPKAEWLK